MQVSGEDSFFVCLIDHAVCLDEATLIADHSTLMLLEHKAVNLATVIALVVFDVHLRFRDLVLLGFTLTLFFKLLLFLDFLGGLMLKEVVDCIELFLILVLWTVSIVLLCSLVGLVAIVVCTTAAHHLIRVALSVVVSAF